MAEILVLAEHDGETVKKVTTELLTLARGFGEPSVVWTGPGADAAQARLAEYGAAKVYVADSADYDDYVVAPKAELLAQLVADKSPAAVLVAATSEGREVAARLAVKTGSGVLTDVTGLSEGLVAEQPIFGGAITVQSKVRAGTPIIAVRPNAVTPEPAAGAAELEPVELAGQRRGQGGPRDRQGRGRARRAAGADGGLDRRVRRPRPRRRASTSR